MNLRSVHCRQHLYHGASMQTLCDTESHIAWDRKLLFWKLFSLNFILFSLVYRVVGWYSACLPGGNSCSGSYHVNYWKLWRWLTLLDLTWITKGFDSDLPSKICHMKRWRLWCLKGCWAQPVHTQFLSVPSVWRLAHTCPIPTPTEMDRPCLHAVARSLNLTHVNAATVGNCHLATTRHFARYYAMTSLLSMT